MVDMTCAVDSSVSIAPTVPSTKEALLLARRPFQFPINHSKRHTSSHLLLHHRSSNCAPPRQHSANQPPNPNPNVIDILEERGLIDSVTDMENLRRACADGNLKVYCGFDPTAPTLHLGNLLALIVLSWFRRCNHMAVALVGGATARIGDPSGKSSERPELSESDLEKNIIGITETISFIVNRSNNTFSMNNAFVVLNNYEWWQGMGHLDFLKTVGRYARVGSMISKESVKKRLESEQGMSYTEFTYQLLQAYDFLHLFEKEGVNLQIGGSDQWGNITAGTDLIRKKKMNSNLNSSHSNHSYGLTFPLLLKADGSKFGKSEKDAIWLSPSMLSPYNFYQYFFSVTDADVVRFLKILTFLDMKKIAELEKGIEKNPSFAQRELAAEVTRFVHGERGLSEAVMMTEALKPGDGETSSDFMNVSFPSSCCCCLAYDEVLNLPVVALSVLSGLVETKSAARRLLKQGGLYLNNQRVENDGRRIEDDDIVHGKGLVLSAGKKNKIVVRIG